MWIARDKDDSLWLFNEKPVRKYHAWSGSKSDYMKLADTALFPDLKWEDEPIEVNIVDANKSIITDKDCIDEVYWRKVRNNAAIAAMQSIIGKWNNISLKSVQEEAAEAAINCADALVKNLKSTEIKL